MACLTFFPSRQEQTLPLASSPQISVTMIQSTVDLISGVASNSLLVFCICNLIIAVLLVSSSRSDPPALLIEGPPCSSPTSRSDDEDEECDGRNSSAEESVNSDSGDEECGMSDAAGAEKITEEVTDNKEDDDELRRSAEEFIEKINRIWISEKMQQTLPL